MYSTTETIVTVRTKNRTYTNAQREHAVNLAMQVGMTDASEMLNIPYKTIHNWVTMPPRRVVKTDVRQQMMKEYIADLATRGTVRILDYNPFTGRLEYTFNSSKRAITFK